MLHQAAPVGRPRRPAAACPRRPAPRPAVLLLGLVAVLVGRQAVLLRPARPLLCCPLLGPWPPVQAAVLAVPAPGLLGRLGARPGRRPGSVFGLVSPFQELLG
ncbi:hypothetical protein ACFWOG_40335 [Kitasatospora sp. NPDC058406]|uniref:hypothetical protein n=1 Tax=Kitasatospora sp. NPDC058406 TaxID=3346483 RepID=UPI00365574E8